MNKLQLFGLIEKSDDEQRMVYGYASTDRLDSHGEVITKEAVAGALEDYMKWANIREMHQPSAVGVTKSAEVDNKGLYISVHVSDDAAWKKVKDGVYKGFSVGGYAKTKIDNTITNMVLTEISLVDRPANSDAKIDMFKVYDQPEGKEMTQATQEIEKQAEAEVSAEVKTEVEAEVAKEVSQEVAPEAAPAAEAAPEVVEKSMGTVARLAYLVSELKWLYEDTEWENEYKESNSDVPNQLKEILKKLGDTLVVHVTEEVQSTVGVEVAEGAMEKSADFKSAFEAFAKAQGFKVVEEAKPEVIAKAEGLAKLESLEAEVAKMASERNELQKRVAELEAKPAPSKAVVRAIAKSEDVSDSEQKVEDISKMSANELIQYQIRKSYGVV